MNRIVKWIVALCVALSSAPLAAQTVEYIHTDALGSVVAISDAAGNIIERREYEPYGAQLTPVLRDGPGYTGHVQDAATGLTYMQQRYYDPQVGLFLSVDPVTAYGGDVRHFSRYVYAYNNPYRFTDPDGRCPMPGSSLCGKSLATIQAQDAAQYRGETTMLGRALGVALDFTPVVGDIKGGMEAVDNPTPANVVASVIGLFGPVGDGAGKILKNAEKISDLKPIHSSEALGNRPDIYNLSDGDLMNSVTNPANGDFITVNTRTGGVVDGNTRVTELQRRASDPNSAINGDTQVPIKTYTPNNSDFPDLK